MKKILFSSLIFCLYITIPANGQRRQKQSWLGALQETHHADRDKVVRIYFDKEGNPYPDGKLYIPYKRFFDPRNINKTNLNTRESGNLEYLYTLNQGDLEALEKFYAVQPQPNITNRERFYDAEQSVYRSNAKLINTLLSQTNEPVLMIITHGFNDTDPTGDFQRLRNMIRSKGYDHGNYVYVEIFWDGLTDNRGNPALAGIWGHAQRNSANVGLGLRQLINMITGTQKIRIITHSLGASVATAALFNTVHKWKKAKPGTWHFMDSVYRFPAPQHNDIRLGMLAPAIPGTATFQDINNRNWPCDAASNNIRRIVIGYNENDYALTKRLFKRNMSRFFGSTTLGCNDESAGGKEIDKTIRLLKDSSYAENLIVPVKFTEFGAKERTEEHGLYYYLLRSDPIDLFLKGLLD